MKREMDHLKIRILGPGCPSCNNLERRTMQALIELNVAADFQKVRTKIERKNSRVFLKGFLESKGKKLNGLRTRDELYYQDFKRK